MKSEKQKGVSSVLSDSAAVKTPASIRVLVEAANPRPWRVEYDSVDTWTDYPDARDCTFPWRIENVCNFAEEEGTEADANLIAHAPDLALLAADMFEALVEIGGGYDGEVPPCFCAGDSTTERLAHCTNVRNLLDRFVALTTSSTTPEPSGGGDPVLGLEDPAFDDRLGHGEGRLKPPGLREDV